MLFFSRPKAGPGWICLNVLRGMSIAALIMVNVASWIMLVKTFIVSRVRGPFPAQDTRAPVDLTHEIQFFFFDAASHLITSCVALFLIISELDIFPSYFATNWPLFAPSSGLVSLGLGMIIVGVSTLGNLNKQATSQNTLGASFWRIVIAAGILASLLGIFNIIANYLFRDTDLAVSARQVRAHGAPVATHPNPKRPATASSVYSAGTGGPRPYHNPYMAERQPSVRSNYSVAAHPPPTATLPSVRSQRSTASKAGSRGRRGARVALNISRPLNFNDQFNDYTTTAQPAPSAAGSLGSDTTFAADAAAASAGAAVAVQRPEDAYHPAYLDKVVVF
ncbi:MAG: hypothetical protein M1826_005819 [Phylliscum demangeonii]|nr:MAG: hypothetical protein M1826_005819 [Phylliscum demangeonii]